MKRKNQPGCICCGGVTGTCKTCTGIPATLSSSLPWPPENNGVQTVRAGGSPPCGGITFTGWGYPSGSPPNVFTPAFTYNPGTAPYIGGSPYWISDPFTVGMDTPAGTATVQAVISCNAGTGSFNFYFIVTHGACVNTVVSNASSSASPSSCSPFLFTIPNDFSFAPSFVVSA